MKSIAKLFAISAVAIALVLPANARAQEQEEGELIRSTRLGLLVPPEIRREKRRAAKNGEWAWTMAAAAGAGYNSNLHLHPNDEVDTAVFQGAVRGEVLHYFNRDNRLAVRAEAHAVPYTATDNADDYEQEISIFYAQRVNDDLKLFMNADVAHNNDSVTNVDGDKLTRDFESWNYQMRPTVAYDLNPEHKLRLQYLVKRKDYDETKGANSLDWWSHGPRILYDWDVRDDVTLGLSYGFKTQNYDEEPAGLADGTEPPSNPDEEHFFHQVVADVSWEASDWLKLNAGVGWNRKDDRFRDYESYDNVMAEAGAKMVIGEFLVSADLEYQHRNYDNRPQHSDGTGELEFDRLDFALASRTQLTRAIGMFAGYGLRWRDTNRSAGTSYRSHTAHQIMVGVAWAL